MPCSKGLAFVTSLANAQERMRGTHERVFSSLAPLDMEIYASFRHQFPNVNLLVLDCNSLKNDAAWASMFALYENRVPDPTFCSMLKLSVHGDCSTGNSVLVNRLIWLAVEIARHVESGGVCVSGAIVGA